MTNFHSYQSGLHVVSKRSVGLFQSAICESGSSLENWAVNNETFENSREVASLLGCPTSSSKIMMECMRTSNPNWIVGQSLNTWKLLILARFSFGPVIERRSPTAFLVEHPRFAYQNKRVPPIPMIIGLTKDEGSLFAACMTQPFLIHVNKLYPDKRHSLKNKFCVSHVPLSGISTTDK